jgi:hypothetical protein
MSAPDNAKTVLAQDPEVCKDPVFLDFTIFARTYATCLSAGGVADE